MIPLKYAKEERFPIYQEGRKIAEGTLPTEGIGRSLKPTFKEVKVPKWV